MSAKQLLQLVGSPIHVSFAAHMEKGLCISGAAKQELHLADFPLNESLSFIRETVRVLAYACASSKQVSQLVGPSTNVCIVCPSSWMVQCTVYWCP